MDPIREALAAALEEASAARPPPRPATLYVGFSGGLDSSVLLHAVARQARGTAVAVHVHHGLQGAADAWAAHCADVCAALGVRCLLRRVQAGGRGSLETRARAARYAVFEALLAEPGSLLLLAHHRQDQAETVLLRLLQGRGLYGMPRSRPLGAGTLLRPLLNVARAELEGYAARHRLAWVEDPSNRDLSIDRNYLRRRVLPGLRRRWPALDDRLLDAAERLRLNDRRLADGLGVALEADSVPMGALLEAPAAARVDVLRLWLSDRGFAAPRRAALTEFLRQLTAADDRQPELRLPGASLRRYRGRVHLAADPPSLDPRYPLQAPGTLRLPHGVVEVIEASPERPGVHAVGPLEVRFRAGGERLRGPRGERSVKQILHDAGVPPWRRCSYPLIYDSLGLLVVPGGAQRQHLAERLSRPPESGPGWRAQWRPDVRSRRGSGYFL